MLSNIPFGFILGVAEWNVYIFYAIPTTRGIEYLELNFWLKWYDELIYVVKSRYVGSETYMEHIVFK